MVSFETDSHSETITIPLSRRISEIMEEKGKRYTQEYVANGIGLSRDTLRAVLRGNRPIYGMELRALSSLFRMSVDRLTMKDTRSLADELNELLSNLQDKQRALQIAQTLASVAVGITERYETQNNLGRAYFLLERYPEAHEAWLEAYKYAQLISKKYDDSEPLFHVVTNLSLSFTQRKEFSNLAKILDEVETVFRSSPKHAGVICYSKAMIAEHLGDVKGAREYFYKSLEFHQLTGEPLRIGRSELNVAYFEYKQSNYLISRRYIESAIRNLAKDEDTKMIALKIYGKVLLKLGEKDRAIAIIEQALAEIDQNARIDLAAKLYILLALARQERRPAERVLHNQKVEKSLRLLAYEVF
jgi:tetratricopeptide (TPR) repeat protein